MSTQRIDCPVCTHPAEIDRRASTCGHPDCITEYRRRKRAERWGNVGIRTDDPTFRHGPVAELTRPSAWADEPGVGTTVPDSGMPNPLAGLPQTYRKVVSPAPVAQVAQRSGRYLRVLIWPDTHLPYADPRAVSLALQVGKYYSPDLVILLGDVLDCTGFSRFPHDTVNPKSFLQTELDEWHSLAESIREMAPHAERRYLIGNHEERIERWLWSQPQLYGLTGMRLESLLTLGAHGFQPQVEREVVLCNGSLTVTHGTRIGGQGSGLAARQEMMRHGTSGVSGHTHRLALVTQRDKAGLRQWIESGHLSLNPPHYQPSVQNWIQGLTLGEVSADGNDFELRPVPFRLSYRCLVDGREFAA